MKHIKLFSIPLFVALGLIVSCNSRNKDIQFDKNKWIEQVDPLFPSSDREKMIADLILNHKMVGLKCSELVELLGIPDDKDTSSLSYKIIIDYGHDIDPVYTKTLDFTFSKDSVITAYKVNEWKKI